MDKGFKKFYNRIMQGVFVKTLLLTLTASLAAFSAAFLLGKRAILPLTLPLSLDIGAGVAVVTFLVTFFLLKPNRRKAAEMIDDALALDERAQTMVSFSDQEGDMLSLQREDTEARLTAISKRSFKLRNLARYTVALCLSVCLLATSFAIPVKGSEQPPEQIDPPYEFSTWQMIALRELIETVKASDMTASSKETVVKDLEGLYQDLLLTETVSAMKSSVVEVIVNTRTLLDETVTYASVAGALRKSSFVPADYLGRAIALPESATVRQDAEAVYTVFVELCIENANADSAVLALSLRDFAAEIKAPLASMPTGDEAHLALTLKALADGMTEIADQVEGYTVEWGLRRLETLFTDFADAVETALLREALDESMGEAVIERLMEIFEITEEDLLKTESDPSQSGDSTDGTYPDPDDEFDVNDGGIGSGKINYGSNDLFYDHDGKGYVEYGEVYSDYSANLDAKQQEGTLPDEINKLISDYFDILKQKNESDDD